MSHSNDRILLSQEEDFRRNFPQGGLGRDQFVLREIKSSKPRKEGGMLEHFFFFFGGNHAVPYGVPRPGIISELQLQPVPHLQQHWTLHLVCATRGQTCIPMLPKYRRSCGATLETRRTSLFSLQEGPVV